VKYFTSYLLVILAKSIDLVDKFPPSDFDVIIDTTKAQKLLNFKPLKIEDGLKKYIEDMKNEKI
jgi:nucleoside-diphosphate-sugar epimerase